MRGVALAVFPAMVGVYALSALTTPSKLMARTGAGVSTAALYGRSDRVKTVDRVQLVEGVPVAVPALAAPPLTIAATVGELAAKSGIDVGTLRWANDLTEGQEPPIGQLLIIPPSRGGLMQRNAGETPDQFAARAGITSATLAAFNTHPEAGLRRYLQVPLDTPGASLPSSQVVILQPGIPAVSAKQRSRGGNNFPFGQCTWYVATKRDVPWNGNAREWLSAARGSRPEGHVPVVGAIVVQTGGSVSPAGHVSYVEAVNPDGSFQISEMNYAGFGVTDRRTLRTGDGVAGFIY